MVCRESRFSEFRVVGICVETFGSCGNVFSCVFERVRGAVGIGVSFLIRIFIFFGVWVRSIFVLRSEVFWGFFFCFSVSWKVWLEFGRVIVLELEKERIARAFAFREFAGRGGKRIVFRFFGFVLFFFSVSCSDRWVSGVCFFSYCERRGRFCSVSVLFRVDRRREVIWW